MRWTCRSILVGLGFRMAARDSLRPCKRVGCVIQGRGSSTAGNPMPDSLPDPAATAALAAERVLILDFGSQVTQLIARRLRESGVYCEIWPFNADPDAHRARGGRAASSCPADRPA